MDLEIHVLNRKFIKAEQEGKSGFANYVNELIKDVTRKRKEINAYLNKNGVKIFEPEQVDDMFVQYRYYQRINGGFKEGIQKYWKAALKLGLKKRMSKYFIGGGQ
ncbi:hypothetical protein P9764_03930 [Bacillus smithii]|uniref:hypothetical protein n=1 Tax=Bacillus smithii TaxID=1479 RepID=UPI002E1C5C3F|nr:hypothetical protein [Bacillus smithii]